MAIAYAYFFSPIETFACNCSSFQKKPGEQKDQVGVQSFLQRQDITKIKLLVENSALMS